MINRLGMLRAPLFVSWQITRDCDLACLHCCTESAPGKRLPDELNNDEAMRVVQEIIRNEVPYVMLCGGEPLVSPHFLQVAVALGTAGVHLKIETNGQRIDKGVIAQLARLPVRSVQISLDGDSQEVYARQRPGGSLAKAHAACRAIREAGLPLEITFAPTRLNIHEAGAVIHRARELGAFRFNSGRLMRLGTAARLWSRLSLPSETWIDLRALFAREATRAGMEICYEPFSVEEGLRESMVTPPATLLILPNGWVKVAAALPYICADMRRCNLQEAWRAYQSAWYETAITTAARDAVADDSHHELANAWRPLSFTNA